MRQFPGVDPLVIGPNGTPFFLHGRFAKVADTGESASISHLRRHLPAVLGALGVSPGQLKLRTAELDEVGFRHFSFGLELHGREIVGASLLMHVDRDGWLYMVNGTIPDEIKPVPMEARIQRDQAREKVRQRSAAGQLRNIRDRVTYVLAHEGAPLHLAWEVKHDDQIADGSITVTTYIDAVTGEHILTEEPIFDAKSRSVRNANSGIMYDERYNPPAFYRPNTVARSEGQGSTNSAAVNAAYDNAGVTYDYFKERFTYDGMNNAGVTANLIANSTFVFGSQSGYLQTGQNSLFANLNFGDGEKPYVYLGTGPTLNPNRTDSHSHAIDIVAHEWTHGVLHYRSIGPLGYNGQTGAINEGLSDVFGAMTERKKKNNVTDANVWLMGETTGTVIRSMAAPNTGAGQFDYFPGYNPATHGPHAGATIVGLAFNLLCAGGTHPNPSGKPGVNVPGIGESAAEQAFFHALRYSIPSGASFQSTKHAIAQSGGSLSGELTRNAVYFAFDAVGVPYGPGNLRAVNISTRAWVGTGSDVMIAGFVISGVGSKPFLARGVGPRLASFGVPGVLANPFLNLSNNTGTFSVANDDWWQDDPTGKAAAASAVGAFSLSSGSQDAATLPTLGAGTYTAIVSGVNQGTGNALMEVYDTDPNNPLRLVNISTRARVRTTDPIIAGFSVTGTTGKKLLIRAVGPRLTSFGVPGALANPTLSLRNQQGHELYSNDDWSQAWNAAAIQSATAQVYAFSLPAGSADSAMLVELPPGLYTGVVSGGDGVALVEVYEVP